MEGQQKAEKLVPVQCVHQVLGTLFVHTPLQHSRVRCSESTWMCQLVLSSVSTHDLGDLATS